MQTTDDKAQHPTVHVNGVGGQRAQLLARVELRTCGALARLDDEDMQRLRTGFAPDGQPNPHAQSAYQTITAHDLLEKARAYVEDAHADRV
ncbi:hypothetical protein [Oceanicaulis sp. MMSF_3324]|uniref:hypothetical protein n=1 Tax=Oceanicaulis sp. MMSF_3324 TaxID=3046702 RepID=UPI00273FFBA9|nr:hypothetical protein [Oceanicaulis sp. MMSF_3324]